MGIIGLTITVTQMTSFKDFPLLPQIQKALDTLQFTTPTEIQEKALASLLAPGQKVDFHGQAQTGTGKTLAFGIPIIQTIDLENKAPQALIVAPTRELVNQICESLRSVAQFSGVSIEPVYGGMSMERQMRELRRGVQIVVGTPGRLNDHLRRKTLNLKNLRTLVLDEADIMLDMGFKEEVDEILQFAPTDRQIWLFSATVKGGIQDLKRAHMKDPVTVRVGEKTVTTSMTKQLYCMVPRKHKLEALTRFIDTDPEFYAMVFCPTKVLASEIAEELGKRRYSVNTLHGDLDQSMRNKVIKGFKERSFNILVATDVAARGIDISDLTHVINYSLPEDPESYVHRIGRTGRAGKEGIAITFIERHELHRLSSMMRRFKITISQVNVPSATEIAQVRLDQVCKKLEVLCGKQAPAKSELATKLRAFLNNRSPEELINGMENLLFDTLLKGSATQEEINFNTAPAASSFAEQNQDLAEIMLNVGIQDGINKGDVLHYLIRSKVVNSRDIGKIRVINKCTFIMVPTKASNNLLAALRGKPLRGKQVQAKLAH